MYKEQITDKEGICLLTIFIMGSTMIIGFGGEAKNDAWIAGILGIFFSVPILLVYGRILHLFPGKDLFEILEIIAGKVFGKVLAVIYIWYSFHLGALVIRNFAEFINTVAMPETPMIVPMVCLGLSDIAAARAGIEVMARVSAYILPVLLVIIFVVQTLGITVLNLNNLKPILGNGFIPILKGAFSAFSFPFAETVIFISVLHTLKKQEATYKVYLSSLVFAGSLIVMISIRNIAVIGSFLDKLYFPAHVAVSRIRIGDFLERMEVTVSIVFIFGVFIKSAVCLLVVSKGVSKLFNLNDYRTIVIQVGLLMTFFSYSLYESIMEMQYFAFKVYAYYAFPFQVIIPLIILALAEIKVRKTIKP